MCFCLFRLHFLSVFLSLKVSLSVYACECVCVFLSFRLLFLCLSRHMFLFGYVSLCVFVCLSCNNQGVKVSAHLSAFANIFFGCKLRRYSRHESLFGKFQKFSGDIIFLISLPVCAFCLSTIYLHQGLILKVLQCDWTESSP